MTTPDAGTDDGASTATGDVPDAGGAVLHGSFALVVDLQAPSAEVFAAFSQWEIRRRWLRLPGTAGPEIGRDYHVGASETLRSALTVDGRSENVERRTQVLDLVPGQRLVFSYRAVVDGACRWISLVTIELDAGHESGTRVTWTEQYAFVRVTGAGDDDVAHLRGGTRLQLNGLAVALGVVPRPATQR